MGFFEDFTKLAHELPRLSAYNFRNKKTGFSNFLSDSNDCHYCFNSSDLDASAYIFLSKNVKKSMDLNNCENIENCFDCSDCSDVTNSRYLINCYKCDKCELGEDLFECSDCFGSVGLYHKKYHIFNKDFKYSEIYEKEIEKIKKHMPHQEIQDKFVHLLKTVPKLNMQLSNCERCAGDYLFDSKGSDSCYNCENVNLSCYTEESSNAIFCADINNCFDIYYCYDCLECNKLEFASHCFFVSNSSYMLYCAMCFNCDNCIGCINLKNKSYHILNKPYTKEEYQKKARQILTEMEEKKFNQLTDFFNII